MTMRNKLFGVFGILLFVLFSFGCQEGGVSRGNGAVSLNFIEGLPRDSRSSPIYEGEQINVGLEVKNYADCDVIGKVCAYGLTSGYGGFFEKQCSEFSLSKISENSEGNLIVDEDEIRFSSEGYTFSDVEYIEPSIGASVTYGCRIVAQPLLCIGQDKEQCSVNEVLVGDDINSGRGPIRISKITKNSFVDSGGTKMRVSISLDDVNDGGKVVDDLDDSSDSPDSFVQMSVSYGGYGDMECALVREGNVLWKNDGSEKVINCDILVDDVKDFEESALRVDLRYYYQKKISKRLRVINTDEEVGGEI